MIFQAVICSFKKTSADVRIYTRIFGSRHLQCNLNKNLKALEYVFIYLSLSRLSSDSYIITGDTYGLLFQIFGRSFKTQASNTVAVHLVRSHCKFFPVIINHFRIQHTILRNRDHKSRSTCYWRTRWIRCRYSRM